MRATLSNPTAPIAIRTTASDAESTGIERTGAQPRATVLRFGSTCEQESSRPNLPANPRIDPGEPVPHRRPQRLLATAMAALLLTTVACSDDDGDSADTTASTEGDGGRRRA